MNEPTMTLQELEARYPYMFEGPHSGLVHFTGWFPTFVQLCMAIDAVLGVDKRGFRWVRIKAKFGTARFHHAMEHRAAPLGAYDFWEEDALELDTPAAFVSALINQAELITGRLCIRCGNPARAVDLDGYVITLCHEHRPPAGAGRAQIKAHVRKLQDGLHAV